MGGGLNCSKRNNINRVENELAEKLSFAKGTTNAYIRSTGPPASWLYCFEDSRIPTFAKPLLNKFEGPSETRGRTHPGELITNSGGSGLSLQTGYGGAVDEVVEQGRTRQGIFKEHEGGIHEGLFLLYGGFGVGVVGLLELLVENLALFPVVAEDHFGCGKLNVQLLGCPRNRQILILDHLDQAQAFLG